MFKRLKNIENAQKNLISGSDNQSIYYTPKSQFDSERDKDEDKKQQQNNNIDAKPPNVFDYLKILIQEVKYLMDEIEDVNKDISVKKLAFIGSNREKFNFNKFRMPLNFV